MEGITKQGWEGGAGRGEGRVEEIWNVKKLTNRSLGGRKHRFGLKDGLARQGPGFHGRLSFSLKKLKTVYLLFDNYKPLFKRLSALKIFIIKNCIFLKLQA